MNFTTNIFELAWRWMLALVLYCYLSDAAHHRHNKRHKKAKDNENDDFFCYTCTSPYDNLPKERQDIQAAIQRFISSRGAAFPKENILADCAQPLNYSLIPTVHCRYPYCAEVKADDYQGEPIVFRGCADAFRASSKLKELEFGGDDSFCEMPDPDNPLLLECTCVRPLCNVYREENRSDEVRSAPHAAIWVILIIAALVVLCLSFSWRIVCA